MLNTEQIRQIFESYLNQDPNKHIHLNRKQIRYLVAHKDKIRGEPLGLIRLTMHECPICCARVSSYENMREGIGPGALVQI